MTQIYNRCTFMTMTIWGQHIIIMVIESMTIICLQNIEVWLTAKCIWNKLTC